MLNIYVSFQSCEIKAVWFFERYKSKQPNLRMKDELLLGLLAKIKCKNEGCDNWSFLPTLNMWEEETSIDKLIPSGRLWT